MTKETGVKRATAADREWEQAGRRHRLSPRHIQMARQLGLNPKKLGSLDNQRQEPWKEPLPQFIERLYDKRSGPHGSGRQSAP